MKFGKLDLIDGVDLNLPPDHGQTQNALKKGGRPISILSGGTMWNIPNWVGKIYPEGTRKIDFIEAYGKQFSTIELNATHYKIPTQEVLLKWRAAMPDDFIFCPKFPQIISHYRRFNNCEAITLEFLDVVSQLENNLGPCFIQLPPNFTSQKSDGLLAYLRALPRDMKFALEFRHPSWFEGGEQAEYVWQVMEELGIGSVITDTAGRRDAVHMRLTTPDCIVRFGGNALHETDNTRLEQWADRIQEWKEKGLESFHFWIHQPESILTPETAVAFSSLVEERMNIKCKSPHIISS